MAFPEDVVTRQVSFGFANTLEEGRPLTLQVTTKASRSLISLAHGYRLESKMSMVKSIEPGDIIQIELPVTDQAGWMDGTSRQVIEVGENQHSHLYSTSLSIYDGGSEVSRYDIGPYPVPTDSGVLDADTMLIPDETVEGVLIAIPQAWADIIANAAGGGGDGKSAYQIAVDNGFVGTVSQWLESLQGEPGESMPGTPGASAYEIAVANGFSGTEAEWLESLQGEDATVSGVVADIDQVGMLQGVYITSGSTVPVGTPPYALVIELPEA